MYIYRDQKKDSKARGHKPPTYNLKQLREWLFNQENFETIYTQWVDSGYNKDKRPSIDRLNDSNGYSFDNIQLMTWKENNQKGYESRRKKRQEADDEEFDNMFWFWLNNEF